MAGGNLEDKTLAEIEVSRNIVKMFKPGKVYIFPVKNASEIVARKDYKIGPYRVRVDGIEGKDICVNVIGELNGN